MTAEAASSHGPVAAVLDTSFFDKGHFNARKVRGLARRLARRQVELWIPHQIVLEWAVHARDVLSSWRQAHKRALNAELLQLEDEAPLDAVAIAEALHNRCTTMPNVRVLEMTGSAAIAGIRDQILGTPPGTVRNGVRTGAVDSSWVRDALHKVDNDFRKVVFLTANGKDVRAAAAAIGAGDEDAVRIWNGAKIPEDSFDSLFPEPDFTPEPEIDPREALVLIASSLLRDMNEAAADDRHGPPPTWITVDDVDIGPVDSDYDSEAIERLIDPYTEVDGSVALIDVRDVAIDIDDGKVIVTYVVRLLTDVRVEGQVIDNDGATTYDWTLLRDRLLLVPYSAEIRDGSLHNVEQAYRAESFSANEGFRDGYDAYRWLYDEELTSWDCITVSPDESDSDINPVPDSDDLPVLYQLQGPSGRTITADLDAPRGISGEWTLDLREAESEIAAVYDPTVHVLAGEESFDAYPPFSLTSVRRGRGDGRPSAEPYTALGAVWRYLVTTSDHAHPAG